MDSSTQGSARGRCPATAHGGTGGNRGIDGSKDNPGHGAKPGPASDTGGIGGGLRRQPLHAADQVRPDIDEIRCFLIKRQIALAAVIGRNAQLAVELLV